MGESRLYTVKLGGNFETYSRDDDADQSLTLQDAFGNKSIHYHVMKFPKQRAEVIF